MVGRISAAVQSRLRMNAQKRIVKAQELTVAEKKLLARMKKNNGFRATVRSVLLTATKRMELGGEHEKTAKRQLDEFRSYFLEHNNPSIRAYARKVTKSVVGELKRGAVKE